MLLVAHQTGEIQSRLAADLAQVETRFAAELLSDLGCVNTLVGHIERYRGKMLRPTLVLLTAAACRPDEPRTAEPHLVLATVLEMVHMATLVHDDILDEAQVRRRGATINHLQGNEAAVMLGDYLISHAYHLCSSLDDVSVSRRVAQATNTVCEGELLQLANRNNWDLDERTYFEIIRRKTASLCGAACGIAAAIAGASPAVVEGMHAFGEKLGIAFQIVDDVLDLTGDEATVGKTLGRDLQKGKLTLPLIACLNGADGRTRAGLLELLEEVATAELDAVAEDRAGQVREAILSADSAPIEAAQARARELVTHAKALAADVLPPSPARGLMLEMADRVLSRRA